MKKITIPVHALERMIQRGAGKEEIIETVSTGISEPAKQGRFASRKTFDYNSISPVNHKHYLFKTLDVLWVDEPEEIVVVTVKVYYHNKAS